MYFLLTKAYNHEEILIHSDLVVSIVPNGQFLSVFTPSESHECVYIRGIDDEAMKAKVKELVREILEEETL